MNQIVDSQFFQSQNGRGEITSENFRVSVFDELSFVTGFGVKPEAFSRSGTTGSTSSLFGACLTDRGHKQTFNPHSGVEYFLFGEPSVNYVNNTVNCNRGLGDVCR